MSRFFNPFTQNRSREVGSVWMYTSAIESVNAVLHSLILAKQQGNAEIYENNFLRYKKLLSDLYDNLDYYKGTFELKSFTQTKKWSIYAVDRVRSKGEANVTGVLNVYDDQMWLIRELLESYRITGEESYLKNAEYLTEYVLDGWDTTLDENGVEYGGIPWGPGYVTKHACSNGPLVSPLVWLSEIYSKRSSEIEYRFVDTVDRKTRVNVMVQKSKYYLDYAKKVYDWQYRTLLNQNGVYADMLGGCGDCKVKYESVDNKLYRAHTELTRAVGEAYTYNSGTMLSGAADLYRVTQDEKYLVHSNALVDASFLTFARKDENLHEYYVYNTDGFCNWFNGVLLRGFLETYINHNKALTAITSFQNNLDYGYNRFKLNGLLPSDLLNGWGDNKDAQDVEGMFQFTFAAEYALLGRFLLEFENIEI